MTEVLFWNIENAYNSERMDFILECSKRCGIIILSEANSSVINAAIPGFTMILNPIKSGKKHIKVFKNDQHTNFTLSFIASFEYNSIIQYELKFINKVKINLICVHLGSKTNKDNTTQLLMNFPSAKIIHNIQANPKGRSIIVGDFNHNPYETFMIGQQTMNTMSSQTLIGDIKYRSENWRQKTVFYNPMWKFLGDDKFNGTYFYKDKHHKNSIDVHWNLIDQVIVSSSIMESISPNNIEIVNSYVDISGTQIDFVHERFYSIHETYFNPVFSDHLPLKFKIDTAKI